MLTDFLLCFLRLISFDYAGIHFNVKIDDFIVTIIRQMSLNLSRVFLARIVRMGIFGYCLRRIDSW